MQSTVAQNPAPPARLGYSIAEAALSFIGAGIAGTLWWAHRVNRELPCTGDGRGCDLVAQSSWAHVTLGPWHDIPIALLGLIGYLVLLTLSLMKIGADDARTVRVLHGVLLALSAIGVIYSWYLQYVAHFKVGAFCVWCFSSACTMLLLFIVAALDGFALRRETSPGSPAGMEQTTTHVSRSE